MNIKTIRNNAKKGLPFEQDAFKKTIKRTLNTDQKLITSVWDDNFTLKDGKTLKEIWEEENVGKDANEYLRTSGSEWKNYKEELRTWASKKLFTGGENNFTNYTPTLPPSDEDGVVFKNYEYISFGNGKIEGPVAQKLFDDLTAQSQVTDPKNGTKYIFNSDGWYDVDGNVVAKTNDDLVENVFQIFDKRFYSGSANSKPDTPDKNSMSATLSPFFGKNANEELAVEKLSIAFPNLKILSPVGMREKIEVNGEMFYLRGKGDSTPEKEKIRLIQFINSQQNLG